MSDYIDINRKMWNDRVDLHYHSAFYGVDDFLSGKSSLKDIEIRLLGDLLGLHVLHLQCHFGMDTLSLARMGAMVTGVDFSDKAIDTAVNLSRASNLEAEFICSDIYKLSEVIDKQFDVVFTSYGTIGWLPDLNRWADVVASCLKPGGRFIMVEFHPVIWMFDDRFQRIEYSYFNTGPIIETTQGSYADRNAKLESISYGWNHSTAEVLNALIRSGLQIRSFEEYDYSPYKVPEVSVETDEGKFMIPGHEHQIPMIFSLEAIRT
ncbi:MAG: class I SAM-dependent methyltransferase [Saprospiraceae bacterium]|nr:MAG: methyltransferase family protein [Bacteroidetes bacterium OLB9]MCO6464764.1 class I SAM-dependent methyltransferase [Saprospiraceae bacterium]